MFALSQNIDNSSHLDGLAGSNESVDISKEVSFSFELLYVTSHCCVHPEQRDSCCRERGACRNTTRECHGKLEPPNLVKVILTLPSSQDELDLLDLVIAVQSSDNNARYPPGTSRYLVSVPSQSPLDIIKTTKALPLFMSSGSQSSSQLLKEETTIVQIHGQILTSLTKIAPSMANLSTFVELYSKAIAYADQLYSNLRANSSDANQETILQRFHHQMNSLDSASWTTYLRLAVTRQLPTDSMHSFTTKSEALSFLVSRVEAWSGAVDAIETSASALLAMGLLQDAARQVRMHVPKGWREVVEVKRSAEEEIEQEAKSTRIAAEEDKGKLYHIVTIVSELKPLSSCLRQGECWSFGLYFACLTVRFKVFLHKRIISLAKEGKHALTRAAAAKNSGDRPINKNSIHECCKKELKKCPAKTVKLDLLIDALVEHYLCTN